MRMTISTITIITITIITTMAAIITIIKNLGSHAWRARSSDATAK